MSRAGVRLFDSIEIRLPIVIGGLAALLLLSSLAVTYYELRSGAEQSATDRLTRVSAQLADLLDGSTAGRTQQLLAVAADPRLAAVLRGVSTDVEAAAAALDQIRLRGDGTLPIELRDVHGRVVAATGEAAAGGEDRMPRHEGRVAFGPLYEHAGEARYWLSVPVSVDGELLGHIVQQRRFGYRSYGEQIERLIGSSIEIHVTSRAGGPWVSVDGEVRAPAVAVPSVDEAFVFQEPGGALFNAVATPVQSDWILVVAMPLEHTLARTYEVMRRLLGFGLLLLLGAGVAAWLVSRRVTAPLQRLSAVADAIAAGDYSRRTGMHRRDEIGHLAGSFDSMAQQVERTHEQLDHRLQEAHTLAAELEAANSRLQHALAEVEAARGEAQQANRAKSEFLATISHEIRTPINAIVGYTDLMDLGIGGPLSGQNADYVERIRRSGAHLTALINDVLDFAKIESGQMRVAREVRSAPESIHEAISMLQARIADRQISLDVQTPVEAVFLGDAQRVQQILLNLLANAVKFTPVGGRIVVSCDHRVSHAHTGEPDRRDTHEWTCITVSDTGIGIAAQQFAQIFEPFVQGASGYTRPHGGTGLGLAISRSLARMMGGDISVESTPGQGSSFTLWLPYPTSPQPVATPSITP